MKNLTNTMKSAILTLLIACVFSTVEATQVDIRLEKETLEGNELFVNVQVKNSERGRFVLAGQNYRIFYNAAAMKLDKNGSTSLLPTKQYSKLVFSEVKENIDASGAGQLSFEDQMGYANFSIDLRDVKNGGELLDIQGEWTTVARIKFALSATANEFEVVWGREGKSDQYATAFVNIAEWKASFHTESVGVNYYGDLNEQRESSDDNAIQVTVGPNPSADFIQVALTGGQSELSNAVLYDLSGKEVKRTRIGSGESQVRIDVTDLAGASYLIELTGSRAQSIHRQLIVVAH